MKLIYVASDVRAGSSFLQLLLATHPHTAGLGEIAQVISRVKFPKSPTAKELPCSCGAPQEECPFWASLLPELIDCSPLEAHTKIRDRFRAKFPDRVLVDSSKSNEALTRYYLNSPDAKDFDLRVLYVIRDFRGWVPSVHKHRRRGANWTLEQTPTYLISAVERFRRERRSLKYGYLQDSYRWMVRSKNALRFLEQSGVPHLIVSYEELVFNLNSQMARIGEFLGMKFDHDLTDLRHAAAHDLYGSPILKKDRDKRSRVFYDHEWMRDNRSIYLAPLLLPVFAFNRSVYNELANSEPRNVTAALPPFESGFQSRQTETAPQLRTTESL